MQTQKVTHNIRCRVCVLLPCLKRRDTERTEGQRNRHRERETKKQTQRKRDKETNTEKRLLKEGNNTKVTYNIRCKLCVLLPCLKKETQRQTQRDRKQTQRDKEIEEKEKQRNRQRKGYSKKVTILSDVKVTYYIQAYPKYCPI